MYVKICYLSKKVWHNYFLMFYYDKNRQHFLLMTKLELLTLTATLVNARALVCTFPGEYGAPVLDEEIELIKESLPACHGISIRKNLSILLQMKVLFRVIQVITQTMCINKKRFAFFVYYEGDIALCSLERAYRDNKSNFKKPVSCHLFPIRVGNYNGDISLL